MPRLSIVIPSLGFDALVEDSLVSVLQHRPEHSEVIVVTADHYDDPYKLGREVRFLTHDESATRMDLANHGWREARGEIVHLLLPGVLAVDGWTDQVLRHFTEKQVAAVAPVLIASPTAARAAAVGVTYLPRGERRVVGAGVSLEDQRLDRCSVLAPTLSAGFYRRETLDALHGFDGEFGEPLADIELGLALRDLGLATIVEPKSRVTAGLAIGVTPRTFLEAMRAERLYRRQVGPSGSNALRHALLIAAEILSGFPRARMITRPWGRMVARREVDLRSRYEARLERARADLQRARDEVSTIRVEFGDAAPAVKDRVAAGARGRRSAA